MSMDCLVNFKGSFESLMAILANTLYRYKMYTPLCDFSGCMHKIMLNNVSRLYTLWKHAHSSISASTNHYTARF